jgi:hypothetical protein
MTAISTLLHTAGAPAILNGFLWCVFYAEATGNFGEGYNIASCRPRAGILGRALSLTAPFCHWPAQPLQMVDLGSVLNS